jgi:hypothetical protein
VTTFVSPVPDPRAYAVDAMSLSWEGLFAYAFPPFRCLAPILHKITAEKCSTVEGARPFTSNRKTRKSANCWTEILNGSISLPTHQSEKIVHFAS